MLFSTVQLSVKVIGLTIQGPATGFLPGVLSANQTPPPDNQNSGSISNTSNTTQPRYKVNSIVDNIKSFFQSTWNNITNFLKSII